jgi:hypothetical protein
MDEAAEAQQSHHCQVQRAQAVSPSVSSEAFLQVLLLFFCTHEGLM